MKILWMAMESANWVIRLCNAMCEQGHQITAVVQGVDEYDKENPVIPHKDLRIFYVPYKEFENPLLFKQKHLQKVIDEKYDFVMGSHVVVSSTAKMVSETLNIPWGIMVLDIPTDLMAIDRVRMISWLKYFEETKYASFMIFNTHISRDEYERFTKQYFPEDFVITYAINMPMEFYKSGINIKGDYVISVCRICDQKNLKLIPQALSFLDGIKKYVAIGNIADGGQEITTMKTLCEQNGIEFIHYDYVSEQKKFELIRDSAAVIYPQKTKYIGGLSPWEGMFVGKSVIVPNLKVLHDLYKDNVIYFQNEDMLSLAKEISFSIGLKSEAIEDVKNEAAEFALKEASFETMATKILGTLQKMQLLFKQRGYIR